MPPLTQQEIEQENLASELKNIIGGYSNEYSPDMIIDFTKIVLGIGTNGHISRELKNYIRPILKGT